MKLLITYKKGAKLILDFKTVKYADEYLKAQNRNIKSYEIMEG